MTEIPAFRRYGGKLDSTSPTIFLTVGLPGCGKSTWARDRQRKHPDLVRVNKDELRSMLHLGEYSKVNEAEVLRIRDFIIDDALKNGRAVIVDDTNLHESHLERMREIARRYHSPVVVVDFTEVPVEVCIERDAQRTGSAHVGEQVIRRHATQLAAQGEIPTLPCDEGTWFTSDLHFGHANILDYCPGRRELWDDLDEMHEGLIDRWNAVVAPDDLVYVLGDMAMGHREVTLTHVGRLNGRKILVAGNHDQCWAGSKNKTKWTQVYLDAGFESIFDAAYIETPKGRVRLSHFPFEGDHTEVERFTQHRPKPDGSSLFHGHVHDKYRTQRTPGLPVQINVGVDVWDFAPVRLLRLLQEIEP